MHRKNLFLAGLIALLFSAAANAQASDRRIDDIRKLYNETNKRIADAEKQEQSDIFVVEIKVNEHSNPYPAVGIYTSAAKFYYTYGDREKTPYPNRLLKINAVTTRSATTTNSEFLYNAAGQLVFGYVRTDGDEKRETRAYFSGGQLIKMTDNDKDVNIKLQTVIETVQAVRAESIRLTGIFNASLKEGF